MAHLARPLGRQILAIEFDTAADNAGRRREEPDDRQAGCGLAAARLADEADRLALTQGEGDPVDGLDDAGSAERGVVCLQA
jgi:hypothetical protein